MEMPFALTFGKLKSLTQVAYIVTKGTKMTLGIPFPQHFKSWELAGHQGPEEVDELIFLPFGGSMDSVLYRWTRPLSYTEATREDASSCFTIYFNSSLTQNVHQPQLLLTHFTCRNGNFSALYVWCAINGICLGGVGGASEKKRIWDAPRMQPGRECLPNLFLLLPGAQPGNTARLHWRQV